MKYLLPLAALILVSACDTQPAANAPAATATPVPTVTPAMLPPGRKEFTAAWTKACPEAKPVNKALCKSKGMTDSNFTCNFALGDDEYRRNTTERTPRDGQWVLADPATACKAK